MVLRDMLSGGEDNGAESVNNDLEPEKDRESQENDRRTTTKRAFLKTGAASAAAALAGCSGDGNEGNQTPTDTPTRTETTTETRKSTPSDTPTESPTETPTETETQTEEPTDTETQTPTEEGPRKINFVADGSGTWTSSRLFDEENFSGEQDYKLNLPDANSHWNTVENITDQMDWNWVSEIAENFWDQEWREEQKEAYNEKYDYTEPRSFDNERFKTEDDLDDKIVSSNLLAFILDFESLRTGEVTSNYRDADAAILQTIVDPERQDTLFSPYFIVGDGADHGNVWAVDNVAGHRAEYSSEKAYKDALRQEESFMIETVYPQGGDVFDERSEEIRKSDYNKKGTYEFREFEHPARYDGEPVNKGGRSITREWVKDSLNYALTNFSFWNFQRPDFDLELSEDFALEGAKYMMNPEESYISARFLKDYSAALRDMHESGEFDNAVVEAGLDYLEVAY